MIFKGNLFNYTQIITNTKHSIKLIYLSIAIKEHLHTQHKLQLSDDFFNSAAIWNTWRVHWYGDFLCHNPIQHAVY